MAELGKKLGKLSLAILENFVEKTLGEKFVDELRKPTDKELAMEAALEKSEGRFVSEFSDRQFSARMFGGVNKTSLGLLVDAVGEFYDHPAGLKFQNILHQILSESFREVDPDLISSAVEIYIDILTEEFALADEKFKQNVSALSDLRSARILRKVEMLLSQREAVKVEATIFRSLHQLPQPPADFTGREELITQLLEDFNSHQGATITGRPIHGLTGMGGIGKTALGLVVAHTVAKEYPDAQIFLDLKGTTAPLGVMDIMRHVILSFEPAMDLRALDETNIQAAYRSVLHEKRALLFLDNARSAEQIVPLQPPDTCAVLVTSRWAFPVPGLQSRRVDVMSEENAEKLLIKLCPRVGELATRLANACACLPLALRIAGSFLQVNDHWRVEKYIFQLNDRKQRLATLQHSREEAELKTEPDLLATFELSYGGLSEEHKKRWRMLGVFPASFNLSAAGAMWEAVEDETLKLLGLLRRYSLLEYDEASSRYSLHDLLADFACSKMTTEEEYQARLHHASHYKDILNAADDLYQEGGENILVGLRLFDLEWENIRAGQAWVAATQENDPALAKLCMQYPDVGAFVLSLRQHPKKKIQWLEAAISSAREIGDRRGEGNALGNLGLAYADLGEARKAIEYYEQALMIDQEIGDRRNEGIALGNLGNAYAALGEAHKAIEYYEQDLVIAREIGDRRGEGAALGSLGLAYADLGESRKAIDYYEGHLKIAREIGDRRNEGISLGNLGNAYAALGEAHKAIEYYEQDLVIAREIGDRRGEGAALGSLGGAYADLGESRKAIDYYEGHLKIAREIGDRRNEGISLGNLGNAYAALGEAHKAIEYYEQDLVIAREIGDRRGEGAALGSLGSAYFALDEFTKAENYYSQQITIVRDMGYKYGEGNAFWGLGICKKQSGDIIAAREMFQKALEIFKEIESPSAAMMKQMLDDLK